MTRKEHIDFEAEKDQESAYRWHSTYDGNKSLYDYSYGVEVGFIHGANWADANPHAYTTALENSVSGAGDKILDLEAKLAIAVEALKDARRQENHLTANALIDGALEKLES